MTITYSAIFVLTQTIYRQESDQVAEVGRSLRKGATGAPNGVLVHVRRTFRKGEPNSEISGGYWRG